MSAKRVVGSFIPENGRSDGKRPVEKRLDILEGLSMN
jgi:hypothetical protein